MRSDTTADLYYKQYTLDLAEREYDRKFKMFFAGLIFAIISFIGSHPISTATNIYFRIIEVVALFFLLISGLLLLAKLSIATKSVTYKELDFKNKLFYFILKLDIHYWLLFILGMILLLIDRSLMLLSS